MSSHTTTGQGRPATQAKTKTTAMTQGRQADSARRRQRVIAALNKATADETEISVSGIARAARTRPQPGRGQFPCGRPIYLIVA